MILEKVEEEIGSLFGDEYVPPKEYDPPQEVAPNRVKVIDSSSPYFNQEGVVVVVSRGDDCAKGLPYSIRGYVRFSEQGKLIPFSPVQLEIVFVYDWDNHIEITGTISPKTMGTIMKQLNRVDSIVSVGGFAGENGRLDIQCEKGAAQKMFPLIDGVCSRHRVCTSLVPTQLFD